MNNTNCDILILTVDTELELPALLSVFDLTYNEQQYLPKESLWYWKKNIQTKHRGSLTICITPFIKQGNPEAGSITARFIDLFQPSLTVLIGTAAGVRKRVNLCDVVIGIKIHYYESSRREIEGEKPKPKEKPIDEDILKNISMFKGNITSSKLDWQVFYRNYLKSLDEKTLPLSISTVMPEVKTGNIASGEKVIVDDFLQKLSDGTDNKIIAGETEGYGFAVASINKKIPWVVLRGISDYGEPASKDGSEKDKYHLPAVASAASFMRFFIENGLEIDLSLKKELIQNEEKLVKTLLPLKIRSVLISTGDKDNLDILIPFLVENDVEIIMTTGSAKIIKEYTDKAKTVNEYVGCESISGTRGTLHPYILAALKIGDSDLEDLEKLSRYGIKPIDMVFVNAKPNKLPDLQQPQKILEYISEIPVGAPALLRWAIRQNKNCIAVTTPDDYEELISSLTENSMIISPKMRLFFLRKSFQYLSERDKELQYFLGKIWSRDF